MAKAMEDSMQKHWSGSRFLIAFGLVLSVLGVAVPPRAADAAAGGQEVPGEGWVVVNLPPAERATAPLLSEPPAVSPERQAQLEAAAAAKLPVPITAPAGNLGDGLSPKIAETTLTPSITSSSPTDFTIYQNTTLAPSTAPNEVASPVFANQGKYIFGGYNYGAALSGDSGSTWYYFSPTTMQTGTGESWEVHGGFNGNQDVLYDYSRNLMIWTLQYLPDSTGNAIRLAWARGNAAELGSNEWLSLTLEPTSYCGGGGNPNSQFDRVQLARTSNYLYIAANVYSSAPSLICTTLIRISLDQILANVSIDLSIFYSQVGFNFTPTHGGTSTLYFARHEDGTHLRVYDWPESSAPGAVTSSLVTHTAYTATGYDCTITSSTDPCANDDDRLTTGWLRRDTNELGFMWDAAQDGGSRPFPYVQVLTMNASSKAVVTQTQLWNSDRAWFLASSGVNARGHVGGTVATAGGSIYPSCHAWIHDDISTISAFSYLDVSTGAGAPAADHWGAYLRTRMSGLNPFQWIGSCYAKEAGVITPRVVFFGRARDAHRRTKLDFNVDGTTDLAVLRPSDHKWYVRGQFSVPWYVAGDIPVPGDYDGDGRTDVAVYRPSDGKWYVKDQFSTAWGIPGDIPVPGDYNGDGATDLAVFRPSDGKWYVKDQFNIAWGTSGDIPAPADYNGDGTTDLAVVRPSDHKWYVRNILTVAWHVAGDIPVPGDYNGDGTADVAVYRPSDGKWYVKDQFSITWGIGGDIPVPGDYDADGLTDIGQWRPSDGKWYIKDHFNFAWGTSGDWPLVAPDTNGDGDPYQ